MNPPSDDGVGVVGPAAAVQAGGGPGALLAGVVEQAEHREEFGAVGACGIAVVGVGVEGGAGHGAAGAFDLVDGGLGEHTDGEALVGAAGHDATSSAVGAVPYPAACSSGTRSASSMRTGTS